MPFEIRIDVLKEKGRIASALVVPICESPWFDGWLGRSPPAALARRHMPTIEAPPTRTARRDVMNGRCSGMVFFPWL